MKKHVFFLFTLLVIGQSAFAYSFSAVAPSGQTLYYNIENGVAKVTSQNNSSPYYTTYPTGALTIPSSVNYNGTTYSVAAIGNGAFTQCSGLTSVTIPSSVTTIGNYAFNGCTGLIGPLTIPNSVTTIGNYAFNGCTGLTGTLTIPNSITSIGDNAFGGCTGFSSIDFNADSCIYAGNAQSGSGSGYSSFYNLSNITSFTFGNNVKIIPAYLCYGLSGLTTLTIPASVSFIGNAPFRYCEGLTTVVFNADSCRYAKVNDRWGYEYPAFEYIENITSFTFGDNVKVIPDFLCHGLYNLNSITIPHSVKSIGNSAFHGCGITSVVFNADCRIMD